MKITIDTKHDSHDEIKKVLQILHHIVEERGVDKPSAVSSEPVNTTNMMNMFDTPTQNAAPVEEKKDLGANFSSFLHLAHKKRDQGPDEQKIEFF